MKFLITKDDELVVAFEREKRHLALDFLENLELGSQEDIDNIEAIILALSHRPKLTLVQ